MAGEFTPWKTSDYFDPWPGVQAGLARRRQNESEFQFRQLQKQHALDKAAEDKYRSEQMAMEAGQLSARLGVQPVMGADGRFDPVGTAKAGVLKKATDEAAIGLAHKHAAMADMTGTDEFFPTAEEQKLMQEPLYRQARGEAEFRMHLERVKDEAIARRNAVLKTQPPLVVKADDGTEFYVNPYTGKSERKTAQPDPTKPARIQKDESGNDVGYWIGDKFRAYPKESELDLEIKESRKATPTTNASPASVIRKFSVTGKPIP